MAMKEEEIPLEGSDVKDDIGGSVECIAEQPKCSYCDKSFTQKKSLYQHMRNIHRVEPDLENGQFNCDKCEKSFSYKHHLYRHMRNIHNIEPDITKGKIICNHCSEYFLRHTDLYRHNRKEHGHDNITKVELQKLHKSNPVQAFNFSRDINKSCYLCPTCERPFIDKHERDKHLKCHEKAKDHLCKFCYATFTSFSNYTLHEQSCSANTSREPTVQSGGGSNIEQIDDGNLELHDTALNKVIQIYRLPFSKKQDNLLDRIQLSLQQVFKP